MVKKSDIFLDIDREKHNKQQQHAEEMQTKGQKEQRPEKKNLPGPCHNVRPPKLMHTVKLQQSAL